MRAAARRAQNLLTDDPTCSFRGGYDDMYHRIWECPHCKDERLAYTTNDMRQAAAAAAPRDDLYWTRGVRSEPWRRLTPPRRDHDEQWFFAPGVPHDKLFDGTVYSDGSALNPQCPEARRAGWAVAQTDDAGRVLKAVYGHVPAEASAEQTAAAGEISALRRAAELSVDALTMMVDYQGIIDGTNAGEQHCTSPKRPNAASWRAYWRASEDRVHTFVKIKSHRTLQEATADDEPGALLRWHGNRAADRFAKMGASTHASPEGRKLADEYEEKVVELAALARWIGRALAQWPRAPTGNRPATRRRRGELAAARRTTRTRAASRYGHHLAMGRDGWHCTTCGKTAATLGGARKLTAERCQGHTANRVGPQGSAPSAHVLWAAEAGRSQTGYLAPDVIWCARCGAYSSTKVYKLGHACPGTLEKSARTRLAAFSCRRHPITRHLLAPPIRLTDAVLAALASGAARRREAFNLLLRGDPCADARPQAEVAANLDHAAIDFNPTPVIIAAPEEEEDPYDGQPVHKRARTSAIGHQFAGGVGFATPEDEFDIDIFGHGFDMDGATHNPAATVDGTADSSRARPLSVYAGAASSTTTSSQVPSPPAGADGATSGSTPLGGDWKRRRVGCEILA